MTTAQSFSLMVLVVGFLVAAVIFQFVVRKISDAFAMHAIRKEMQRQGVTDWSSPEASAIMGAVHSAQEPLTIAIGVGVLAAVVYVAHLLAP